MSTESETPTFGRLRRMATLAIIFALSLGILVLLAERNSRFYYLGSEGDMLVVSRGAWLPWGKRPWTSDDPTIREVYGPLPLPVGEPPVPEQRFDERQELDRALFEVLAGWADAKIRTDEPVQMREGLVYVERASRLTGITPPQRKRLRALRAELAFYEGRDSLERGGQLLQEARDHLELATEASNARAREAVAILDDLQPGLERINRALQTARGLRLPVASLPPPPEPIPAQQIVPAEREGATVAPGAPGSGAAAGEGGATAGGGSGGSAERDGAGGSGGAGIHPAAPGRPAAQAGAADLDGGKATGP